MAEAFTNNFIGKVSENIAKSPFFQEEKPNSEKVVNGGSEVLCTKKKISPSVLVGATTTWLLLNWLNYHFLSLVILILILWMLVQFFWKNALSAVIKNPPPVPRVVLPEEVFVNMGKVLAAEVNRGLSFLQDAACGGNTRQFLGVLGSLLATSIVGARCNFFTVVYIGYVAMHAAPVLYERFEDQIDVVLAQVLVILQNNCNNLGSNLMTQVAKGNAAENTKAEVAKGNAAANTKKD